MQRKSFIRQALLAVPATIIAPSVFAFNDSYTANTTEAFIVNKNASRFGDDIKFRGVSPNNLKISSKDTNGQLSVFEFIGLEKTGPSYHIHFDQDEIFTVVEGKYRFVVDGVTHELSEGQTIFLPRQKPHTWIQLTDKGRLIYMLQPAGKMEEFFIYMNQQKQRPSQAEMDHIHKEHGMKVVGPPLTL
jgi:quercetin 2,3-dioxygenase